MGLSKGGVRGGGSAGRAPLSTPFALAPRLAAAWRSALADVRAQTDRWFLWSPVAFGGGCGVYFALPREPALWLGVVLAALAVAAVWAVRARGMRRGLVVAASLIAFAACGFLAAELRARIVAAPIMWQRTTAQVDGWVLDVAGPGSGGGRLLIAPYAVEGVGQTKLPALVRVTVGPTGLIGPGAAVRLRAILGPPPEPASPGAYDFARDAYFQRVGAVGFSLTEPIMVEGPRPPLGLRVAMAVNAARWALARRMIDDMGPRDGGVAVAMTTGHEAWLQPDAVADMRNAGLTHILSISGVHMAIVGGFVFLLARTLIALWPWAALRVSGKKVAAGAGLVAIAVYLVVSGAPPPAVRSAVTVSTAFCAILADRRAISLHALAVAALVVLALQPEAVDQPGFQMSFAATAALVALAEAWPRPPREINTPWPIRMVQGAVAWLMAGVAVSFVAGLATGPFAIQDFNRVAIYGLPANLAMEPLSSLVIMPALAGGALLETVGWGGPLLHVAGWGVEALLQLARLVAAWPKSTWVVSSAPDVALPVAFLGVLWLCLWRGRLRWLGVPAALAVSLWPRPAPPAAWIASDGGAAAIVDHGAAVFLRPGRKTFASDLWARRQGLTEPQDADALMKRHYDCNRRRCLPTAPDRPRIAAWWTQRAPSADDASALCASADLVILRARTAPTACGRARMLTAADFARGGSAEIYPAGTGWRVVWARDLRGVRPWTAPPQSAR
ncbi:MAG: ComEC/Rec2 family competence protein [Caulobacteraceae bacterium]